MSQHLIKMVDEIQRFVRLSPKVINAMQSVDRAFFVPEIFSDKAYSLDALPIEQSQWISSPLTVAIMTQSLMPQGGESVLEVGCGSGYQAMILSKLFRRVCTIERIERLFLEARKRFSALSADNIFSKLGDGQDGWEEHAPYDAVIFSACAQGIALKIIEQLKEGGVLLMPFLQDGKQHITRFVKIDGALSKPLVITQCLFVDVCDGILRQ